MYLSQYLPYAITLIFILLPAVLLGLQQRSLSFYGLSGSFLVLLLVFGSSPRQLFYLLGAFFWSMCLIQAALLWRKKQEFPMWSFSLFLLSALLPMLLKNFLLLQEQHLLLYTATACLSLKTIQILVSIQKEQIQTYPAGECAGYLLFFPSLFLGPLNTSLEFRRAWTHVPNGREYPRLLSKGIKELLWGIFYLPLLSHFLFLFLQELELRILEGSALWYLLLLYPFLYGIWLFCFLAGSSRLASGCSCLLGLELPENFHNPFLSANIREFWNRWQMTFTYLLKELVYQPVTERLKKSRQFSCPLLQKCIGYLITMCILGVFYGLRPSSLLFALYHVLLLCLLALWQEKLPVHKKYGNKPLYKFFSWLLTLILIFFGFFILSGMFLKLCFL